MAAEKLPSFTKVPNPFQTFSTTADIPPFTKPPSGFKHPELPSDEWKTLFRKRLEALRKNMISQDITHEQKEEALQYRLPGPKDRPGWQLFLFGPPKSLKLNPASRPPIHTGPVINSDTPAAPKSESEQVEVEEEFFDTQPVNATLDIDDASTSDEEIDGHQPSHSSETSVLGDDTNQSEIPPPPDSSLDIAPPVPLTEKGVELAQPTTALLKRLDQFTVAQVLLFYEFWMRKSLEEEDGFSMSSDSDLASDSNSQSSLKSSIATVSSHHLRWLFALIVAYHNDLMEAKDVSNLRSLARVSIELICRSIQQEQEVRQLNSESGIHDVLLDDRNSRRERDRITGRTGLWMVVAAVVSIWGQADIWDEANEKLHTMDSVATLPSISTLPQ